VRDSGKNLYMYCLPSGSSGCESASDPCECAERYLNSPSTSAVITLYQACAFWDFSRPQAIADGGLANRPAIANTILSRAIGRIDQPSCQEQSDVRRALEEACADWDYSRPALRAAAAAASTVTPAADAVAVDAGGGGSCTGSARPCGLREREGVFLPAAASAAVDSC
jgi:hypothetical protein